MRVKIYRNKIYTFLAEWIVHFFELLYYKNYVSPWCAILFAAIALWCHSLNPDNNRIVSTADRDREPIREITHRHQNA